jgi:hypothetical protein
VRITHTAGIVLRSAIREPTSNFLSLYLDEHYLADHNRRYARPLASAVDHHRLPTVRQLDKVLWLEEEGELPFSFRCRDEGTFAFVPAFAFTGCDQAF